MSAIQEATLDAYNRWPTRTEEIQTAAEYLCYEYGEPHAAAALVAVMEAIELARPPVPSDVVEVAPGPGFSGGGCLIAFYDGEAVVRDIHGDTHYVDPGRLRVAGAAPRRGWPERLLAEMAEMADVIDLTDPGETDG